MTTETIETAADEITEEQVLAIIREVLPEAPAHVDQTGGGTATVFIGTPRTEPDYGERYWLGIGPGWCASRHWRAGEGRFQLGDLYVGPDDCGERPFRTVHTLGDLRAALIAQRDAGDWRPSEWETVQR